MASSGGGKGIVCENSEGTIGSVELLDLWESQVLYGKNPILRPNVSTKIQVENLSRAFLRGIFRPHGFFCADGPDGNPICETSKEGHFKNLMQNANLFLEGTPSNEFLKIKRLRNIELQPTNDSFEDIQPGRGCKVKQIVRYKDRPYGAEVLINQDYYEQMHPTHQAALIVHEIFYASLRKPFTRNRRLGELSSIRIRKALAHIASGGELYFWEERLPEEFFHCQSNSSDLLLIKDEKTQLYFSILVNINERYNFIDPNAAFPISYPLAAWKSIDAFVESRSDQLFPLSYSLNNDYTYVLIKADDDLVYIDSFSGPDIPFSMGPISLRCGYTKKHEFFYQKSR